MMKKRGYIYFRTKMSSTRCRNSVYACMRGAYGVYNNAYTYIVTITTIIRRSLYAQVLMDTVSIAAHV